MTERWRENEEMRERRDTERWRDKQRSRVKKTVLERDGQRNRELLERERDARDSTEGHRDKETESEIQKEKQKEKGKGGRVEGGWAACGGVGRA